MNFPTTALRAGFALLLPLVSLFAASPAHAATTGEQKTAVILVNFQDLATQPITPAAANTLVFGTVSDYYWEASYQKTFLSGATYGWVTIPVSEAQCNNTLFAQEADKKLIAAGVNLAQYERLIYLMPGKACMDGGTNSGTALPARVFATSNDPNAQLVIHELAHTFGLMHSGTQECGSAVIGTSCTDNSYGDLADTMGGGYASHFNTVHKERLGWLGAVGTPAITTVSASGTYALSPFETMATGAKALKIARGIDLATGKMSYYYVEYRQAVGFDAGLGAIGTLTKGVLVHLDGVNSNLLDMTPNSDPSSNYMDTKDAALAVGRSYTDSTAGVTITLQSMDANGAVVQVTVGGGSPPPTCTRATPTVSVTGPTSAVAAGSSLSYTVNVTNRDSSACAATTFALARSVPAGWTGTLGSSSVTLSPGASTTTTLSVASATTAAAGSYGIGVGSSSAVGSAHTANASITYSVAAASGVLSESVGTDKSSYLRGETVAMSARVLSSGAAASGVPVRFTVTLPGGAATVINATTGSDGFARATLKLGKTKSAIGTYAVRADATSGSQSVTASAGFSAK
ncbi:NEW3 domain-containing protein [Lysobacter fragariae]